MWKFCLYSLFREYGWQFFWRVAMPHPVKTTKAVWASGALDFSGDLTTIGAEGSERSLGGSRAIVGVGFCLKPMDPPCPSGRFNHDCYFLENDLHSKAADVPAACRQCVIREIGILALRAGAAYYVMTSAKDILRDLFEPALDAGRFAVGLFVLCRYSLRPFAVGLLAGGIRGWMFPFEKGDCRDYQTWLQADRGIKEERTKINSSNRKVIREFLQAAAQAPPQAIRFEKRGNLFYPLGATGNSGERNKGHSQWLGLGGVERQGTAQAAPCAQSEAGCSRERRAAREATDE